MPSPQKNIKNSTRPAKSLRLLRSLKVLIQAVKPRPFKLSTRLASRNAQSNVATQALPQTPPARSHVSEEARSDFATFTSGVRAAKRAQHSQEHEDETPICEGDCVVPMKRKMVLIPVIVTLAPPSPSPASRPLQPTQQDDGEEHLPKQTQVEALLEDNNTDEPLNATSDASSLSSPTTLPHSPTPTASQVSSASQPSNALVSFEVTPAVPRDNFSITVATDLVVPASSVSAELSSRHTPNVEDLHSYEAFVSSLPRSTGAEFVWSVNGAVPDNLQLVQEQAAENSLPFPPEMAQDSIRSQAETGSGVVSSFALPPSFVPASSDLWIPPDMPHVAPDSSLLLRPDTPDLTVSWSMTTASESHSELPGPSTLLTFDELQPSYMDEDQPADEYMALVNSPVGSSSMDIDSDDLYTPQFGGNSPTGLVLFEDTGSRSPTMAMDDVLPFYTSMLPKAHWTTTPEQLPVAMDTYSAPSFSPPGHLLDWQSTLAPPTCSPLTHLLGLPLPSTVPPQNQPLMGAPLGCSSRDLLPPIELVSTGPSRSRVANRRRLLPYDASLRRSRRSAPQVPDYEVFLGHDPSGQVQEEGNVQESEEPADAPDRGRRSAAPSPGRQLFFFDPPETQALDSAEGSALEEAYEHQDSANAVDSFSANDASHENTSSQVGSREPSSTLPFPSNDDPERDADDEHEESDTEAPESETRATTPRLVIKLSAQSIQSTMVKIDREKAVEQATLDALDNLTLTRDTGTPLFSGSSAHP